MASRGRSSMMSDDPDRGYPDSSPDPLNASINENRAKSRQARSRVSKPALVPSSNYRSNASDSMDFLSPSRSMIVNTPRTGGASPWRIKVTVEAEPGDESDAENKASPTVTHLERKTTTTVPLKDNDAPSPVKRGRGRPRKSETTTSPKPKRAATPKAKKRQSPQKNTSVGVSDASAADLSADAPPKGGRGRPRKSIAPEVVEQDTEQQHSSPFLDEAAPKPTLQGKSLMPAAAKGRRRVLLEEEEHNTPNKFGTPPSSNVIKRLKDRKGTPHSKVVAPQRRDSSDEDDDIDTPSGTEEEVPIVKANEKAPTVQNKASDLDSDDTIALEAKLVAMRNRNHDDGQVEYDDVTTYAFDEGVTRMADDTTILDSENFSMISVDSLLGHGGIRSPNHPQPGRSPSHDEEERDLDQSYLNIPSASLHTSQKSPRKDAKSSPAKSSSDKASPAKSSHARPSPAKPSPAKPSPAKPSPAKPSPAKPSPAKSSPAKPSPAKSSPAKPSPAKLSPAPLPTAVGAQQRNPSVAVAPVRQRTPSMDLRCPSNPPALEPAHFSPTEVETPRIGRVVKAGAALQGVVDPTRITPTAVDPRKDNLGDLFRGFSEGTRKDLQAGLRLGEQLAMHNNDGPSSRRSTPALLVSNAGTAEVSLSPNQQRTTRLLTPEEQEDDEPPLPTPAEEADVHYPSLRVLEQDSHLVSPAIVSPAMSDDEMSWQADTPPVKAQASNTRHHLTAINEQGEQISGTEIYVENRSSDAFGVVTATKDRGGEITASAIYVVADGPEKEEYSDIWQEEASRSSDIPARGSERQKTPQLEDLFANEGLVKPARAKLPRTWRRKSSSNFQYSDEAEEPAQQPTPSSSEKSDEPVPAKLDKGKRKMVETTTREEPYTDGVSEGNEDTGLFFQPELYTKKPSAEFKKRQTERIYDSIILDDGSSLLPDPSLLSSGRAQNATSERHPTPKSSPQVPPKATTVVQNKSEKLDGSLLLGADQSSPAPSSRTPVATKPNPFKNTPIRFSAVQTLPVKSSPLRQEYRASDSEESFRHGNSIDESTLPVSSPFHTNVDISTTSAASDQRQFRAEMEGRTDSSIRHLREEADARADAYSSQYRSLHEIEEVTEQSRTTTFLMPSSPPKTTLQKRDNSEIEPSTLLDDGESLSLYPESASILRPRDPVSSQQKHIPVPQQPRRPVRNTVQVPIIAKAPPSDSGSQTSTGSGSLFNRLTSTLWGAKSTAETPTPLPLHPATQKFDPLPKVQPWTKTHYKTLDALYQMHKKDPSLFATSLPTSSSTTSPNEDINTALLKHFLSPSNSTASNSTPAFLNARYTSWGYSVRVSEALIVLCAAYMSLLTLADIEEYEQITGKRIQMGDCAPGEEGSRIDKEEVVKRLATVIMGEKLRRDEKRGVVIDRRGGMEILWGDGRRG